MSQSKSHYSTIGYSTKDTINSGRSQKDLPIVLRQFFIFASSLYVTLILYIDIDRGRPRISVPAARGGRGGGVVVCSAAVASVLKKSSFIVVKHFSSKYISD